MNHMKFLSVAVCILLLSCTQVKSDGFKINGKTNYLGKVYLNETIGQKFVPIDSAEIANGGFTFIGNVNGCEQHYLTFEKEKGAFGFFLSNEEIDVTISDEHPYFSIITKSPLNLEYQVFTSKMDDLNKNQKAERQKYYAAKDNVKRDSLLRILQSYGLKQSELAQSTFDTNIAKPYASSILARYLKNSYSIEQLDSIINKMPIQSKSNKVAKQLITEIEASKKSAEGQLFINIEQKNPEGKLISLKDVVANNKCVLIDFWASWCSPCIASIPEIKKTYAKYKDQGFEIYAVSIDNKKDKWVKAINKYELSWIHVSELKGWDTQPKTDYAIQGVPTTVLINKDGIIVAKNKHGKELEDAIKDCFK